MKVVFSFYSVNNKNCTVITCISAQAQALCLAGFTACDQTLKERENETTRLFLFTQFITFLRLVFQGELNLIKRPGDNFLR